METRPHPNLQMIERRRYPRVDTQLPAKIVCPDGKMIVVKIANMSQSGLLISCDSAAVHAFLPNGKVDSAQNPDIEIRFSEKLNNDGRAQIRLWVRPIVGRRMSQDIYHIGLKYIGMTDKNAQRIQNYIATLSATD